MNVQRSYGADGYVHVTVEADGDSFELPEWLNTRLIVDAAMAEYRRQRTEGIGALPTASTRQAFGSGIRA